MRILEASIRGFGRLVDRRIRFSPRAQIIVGENEVGKSTLQKFVLAMLFGLKRENRRRREYLDQYELFRPWSGAPYAGRLQYDLSDAQRFEVIREFDRNNESVQVLDAVSGRDLTSEFPLDARKERTFMQKQLQLTRQLFEGTTSLGQMAGRPSAAGVGAFRERIQGLLDSGDEGISARRALDTLRELRDHLGSERTPTRGIGLLLKQRKVLQTELAGAQLRHAEVLELHRRKAQALEEHQRAESAWRGLRAAEVHRERSELERRAERAARLDKQLGDLRGQVARFDDVENLDAGDYAPARARAAAIEALEGEVAERSLRLEELESERSQLHRLEGELARALGDLDRSRFNDLARLAERLREGVGGLREARHRHEDEQRRNRDVVESLRAHHGRDWTRDDFLAEVAARRRDAADRTAEPVQREAQRCLGAYQRRRRRFQGTMSASGVLLALSLVWAVWNPAAWALPPRLLLCLSLGVAALVLGARSLRRVVADRDHARALHAQAARLDHVRREATRWLAEAMARNEVESVEALFEARREYESLRASAERSVETPPGRELQILEGELSRLASTLRVQLEGCDLHRFQGLQTQASDSARQLLPFAEEDASDVAYEGDPPELHRLVADLALLPQLRRALTWMERVREQQASIERETQALRDGRDRREARLEGERSALQDLLRRNGVRDMDDFAARVERHAQRQAAMAEYLPMLREQEGILGGDSVDGLRARVDALMTAAGRSGASAPAAEKPQASAPQSDAAARVDATLESLGQDVERLAAERAQLEERLTQREGEGRRVVEIELELGEVESKLADERGRDASLQLAASTLEEVATAVHRQVAPRMNQRVGEIFARLSRGHHTEVRLDEDLTPRVRMDQDGMYGAESLSGGAVDQLYFALRVTAGEQLASSGERLPLLLDDPFVQYDPERLNAALDLVAELTQEHQVLFFTCELSQAQALEDRLRARSVEPHVLQL
jgi:uncharacterized protein YhaN